MLALKAMALAAVGTIASTAALPPTHCTKYETNIQLQGNHLISHENTTSSDCAQLCLDNSQCRAYSWSSEKQGICWLKSGYDVGYYKHGAISGAVLRMANGQCPRGNYFVIQACDMYGNDVRNAPGKDYSDCMRQGDLTQATFTWSDYNGGTCWFKSSPKPCTSAGNKYSGVFTRYTGY